ncbi:CIS tube protein [Amycolatopsis samaneae]|uniref:Peptidoglycan-binding protein n=1 Tax=Amycolatopsis samaneae TaxID=664691 RepID=A0ABW5GGU6_9PSEU
MGMTVTKIRFDILDGKPSSFEAQFNPTDYSRTKAAQIAEIGVPGIDSPILQFVRGQNERLTLDLLFDSTDQGGLGVRAVPVTTLTDKVYRLVKIRSDTHAPPKFRVSWGTGMSFVAIAEQVQQKFTLFSPAGIPLRATVSLSLREYKTLEEQLKELNLQSPDHTKSRVVVRGQTLSDVAAAEYGDPGAWRVIAAANPAVTDPRRPKPGTALVIPVLDPKGART